MIDYKKNILKIFKDLVFNEKEHSYSFMNNPFKYSVSQYLKKFNKPFEADYIASIVALKKGVSKEDILKQWDSIKDEACVRGNKAHLFGELYAFDRTLKPKTQLDKAAAKFWDDLPPFIIPCINELQIFCVDKKIAGTLDILLFNQKTNKFIIADFKTNKDLFKNYKCQKLLKPFNFLLDNPFNKYQLQLSLYKLIFEQRTGYEVERTRIVWLKDDGEYSLYDTEDYTELLQQTF